LPCLIGGQADVVLTWFRSPTPTLWTR